MKLGVRLNRGQSQERLSYAMLRGLDIAYKEMGSH